MIFKLKKKTKKKQTQKAKKWKKMGGKKQKQKKRKKKEKKRKKIGKKHTKPQFWGCRFPGVCRIHYHFGDELAMKYLQIFMKLNTKPFFDGMFHHFLIFP